MKSSQTKVLVLLILAAVVAVIFVMMMIQIKKGLDRQGSADTCRTSLLLNAKIRTMDKWELTAVDCPKTKMDIGMKELEKKNKKSTEMAIKRLFAEELKMCWYKGGRGNITAFPESMLQDDLFCMICSEITFKDDVYESLVEEKGDAKVVGFQDYLKDTPYMLAADETNTYLEYLTNNNMQHDYELKDNIGGRDIPDEFSIVKSEYGNKKYLTVFLLGKDGNLQQALSTGAGGAGGVAIGIAAAKVTALIPVPGARLLAGAIFAGTVVSGPVIGYMYGEQFKDYWAASTMVESGDLVKIGCTTVIQ